MKKKIKSHVCKFTKTSKTFDLLYPPTSTYAKIKRKFREILLVSEENGRRCFTPQGNAGYIFEKERQLTRYFYMIHPYSKFRQYWEMVVMAEIYLGLLVRSYIVSMCSKETWSSLHYQLPAVFLDLLETSDVLMQFLVGYIDKKTGEVVLEYRKVFFHNLYSFTLLPRVIISFPWEFCMYLSVVKTGSFYSVFQYCVFIKIFKSLTLTRYLRHMAKIYNWKELCMVTVKGFLFTFLLCHWLTCFCHLAFYSNCSIEPIITSDETGDSLYQHFRIFYTISSIIFNKNGFLSQIVMGSILDKFFWFVTLVTIYFWSIVTGGLLIQFLALIKTSNIYYDEMIQEVQKFLAQENLPKQIHKKVIKYLQFRFGHRYFIEKIILETLSPSLQREVVNFLCLKLLIHPKSIFNGIPNELATDLCLLMTYEIFLPGDIIFRAGKKATKMWFLYSGSVAVYSERGKEIMHWYEGQQFGASCFVVPALHPVTIIALEMSECYALRLQDFLKTAAEYPQYIEMVRKNASERRRFIMELYSED